LSQFKGKTEKVTLEMLYSEWQAVKAKMKADGVPD